MPKYELETKPIKPWWSPAIATLLSLIFLGGGGQIYLGQSKKGVAIIGLTLGPPILLAIILGDSAGLLGGLIGGVIGVMIWILGVIDAYQIGKRIVKGNPIAAWEFFWNKSQPPLTPIWQVMSIVSTGKSEEFVGEETKAIDNSRSNTNVTRSFTVSREWSQSFVIEQEKTQTKTQGTNIKIIEPMSVQKSVVTALRDKYSISEGTKRTYSEEVSLQVPAHKNVRILIQWKNIWQTGIITLRNQQSEEIEVPFQVLEGVTFDQSQVDEE